MAAGGGFEPPRLAQTIGKQPTASTVPPPCKTLDSSKNDFKHLTLYKGKYFFNVYDEKNEYGMSMKDRLNQSIEFDQLDNFVFYTSNPIMKRKYVVGDKIKFSFLKVLKAKDVMSSLSYNESNNNFYKII